jgi:hypothetical protein
VEFQQQVIVKEGLGKARNMPAKTFLGIKKSFSIPF